MLYKMPPYRSSKIFATRVFWRLRNHSFDGHISELEQDRHNLKPCALLPTKSPMPYRLVTSPCMSCDHTISAVAFLAFLCHKSRRKWGEMVISPVVGHAKSWDIWGPVLGVTALQGPGAPKIFLVVGP